METVYPFALIHDELAFLSNSSCMSKSLAPSVSLATIGVCIFCAVASVAALFVLEEFYEKDSSA